jgi:endonuclease/exonuclease/phosphatase family metal-dependent hydrolase
MLVETARILTHGRRTAQPIPPPPTRNSDNRFRIGIAAAIQCAASVMFVVSSGCARPVIDAVPDAPIVLVVVTWNTHSGRGDLSRLVSDLESGTLTPRATAYVVLLQEVALPELDAVVDPRKWSAAFVPVRGVGGRVRGNAILSTAPLTDPRAVPLSRERQTRAAAAASIDLDGRRLFVASVHLENRASWWKGGLLGDTARQHQVESLLHALPADGPGILGGDLNTWLGPNEPAWRALAARFAATPDWPRPPTFADRLVLDHVLMDLPDGWRVRRRVVADDYGSDHHPVIGLVSESP